MDAMVCWEGGFPSVAYEGSVDHAGRVMGLADGYPGPEMNNIISPQDKNMKALRTQVLSIYLLSNDCKHMATPTVNDKIFSDEYLL